MQDDIIKARMSQPLDKQNQDLLCCSITVERVLARAAELGENPAGYLALVSSNGMSDDMMLAAFKVVTRRMKFIAETKAAAEAALFEERVSELSKTFEGRAFVSLQRTVNKAQKELLAFAKFSMKATTDVVIDPNEKME